MMASPLFASLDWLVEKNVGPLPFIVEFRVQRFIQFNEVFFGIRRSGAYGLRSEASPWKRQRSATMPGFGRR